MDLESKFEILEKHFGDFRRELHEPKLSHNRYDKEMDLVCKFEILEWHFGDLRRELHEHKLSHNRYDKELKPRIENIEEKLACLEEDLQDKMRNKNGILRDQPIKDTCYNDNIDRVIDRATNAMIDIMNGIRIKLGKKNVR
jgi:hypothetical protein